MKNTLTLLIALFLFSTGASAQTSPEVKQLLIEHGIDENDICLEQRGRTPWRTYTCDSDFEISKELANEYVEEVKLEKLAKLEEERINARVKNFKVSDKEVRKRLTNTHEYNYAMKEGHAITNEHRDAYLKLKERERKGAELERNAKIHKGKQYVCSDGYDSWVLKYNGNAFTFGELNFDMYSSRTPIIDRLNGTVTYKGNKSTCKPR